MRVCWLGVGYLYFCGGRDGRRLVLRNSVAAISYLLEGATGPYKTVRYLHTRHLSLLILACLSK